MNIEMISKKSNANTQKSQTINEKNQIQNSNTETQVQNKNGSDISMCTAQA